MRSLRLVRKAKVMEQGRTGKDNPATAPWQAPARFLFDAQGHSLDFISAGPERLDTLLELIGGARETLRLCFYIFSEDEAARRVRDALAEAAGRGVDVHLIIDDFGSQARDGFFAPLVEAGGRATRFSSRWSQRYVIRNHQKMVLADGRKAMIGGFNVADDYFARQCDIGWQDLGLVIEGPAVADLCKWYALLEAWADNPKAKWRAIRKIVREWNPGTGHVQVLIGGPSARLSTWARLVGKDLLKAQRLDMVMAYFSPPAWLLRRIGKTARRGDVRLVMAGKTDNPATIGASRALYNHLLKRDTRIWEFTACRLHTKLIVVDDTVYVGSANFDMRSLYLNLELMLRIEDAALAERVRQLVSDYLPGSREITDEIHRRNNTLFNRLRWNISWFLVAVLDYTVSRRLNLGL